MQNTKCLKVICGNLGFIIACMLLWGNEEQKTSSQTGELIALEVLLCRQLSEADDSKAELGLGQRG